MRTRFLTASVCLAVTVATSVLANADLTANGSSVTSSAGMVAPDVATSAMWAAPNKLTVEATLEKIKNEDGPSWLASMGAPSDDILRRVALHQPHLERGLGKSIVFRRETRRKVIALTFDDGPHPGWTPKLLTTLHECGVPATFFVVGHQVEKYPELARAIDAMGYSIGNHTYDHVSLLKIPGAYVPTELLACADAVKTATGVSPRYFRPPGGEFDKSVAETAEEMGYQTVLWTDDPGDFARPSSETILKRTVAKATPGGIILLHDGIPETLEMIPELVSELKLEGYEFVSLDELMHERETDARVFQKALVVPADFVANKESRPVFRSAPKTRQDLTFTKQPTTSVPQESKRPL